MIYEFDARKERFAYELGVLGKLERLDKIPRPRTGEVVGMAINWNVFDWSGNNNDGYGEIEQDGKQTKPASAAYASMSFKDGKLTYGDVKGAQIGAGMAISLVIDGKVDIRNPAKMSTAEDKRTACGQKANGNILFVTVDKMTTQKLAEYMLSLGCVNAFQGDSGGSTGYYDGIKLYDQGRAIAGALVAYRQVVVPKTNIVLAYSQQYNNKCAIGDTEADHMYPIAKALSDILRQDKRLNVYLIPQQHTGTDNGNLKASIMLSNGFIKANGGKGFHLEVHSDAYNGKGQGASALYLSDAGLAFITPIYNELSAITPTPDRGIIKRTDLGALNQTLAVAGILEVSFHDEAKQAKFIHDNAVFIAATLAVGTYKSLKL